MKKKIYIILVIIALALIITCSVLLILKRQKKEEPIEEPKINNISGSYEIRTGCPSYETIKYTLNNKEQSINYTERIQEGTTTPECLFKIKKEEGTYTFEEFSSLIDGDITLFNQSFGYNKKLYKVSTNTDNKEEKTYRFDYTNTDNFYDSDFLIFLSNNKIKYIKITVAKGDSFYITISKDSIKLSGDENTIIMLDIDTMNENKGHSKLFNLHLSNDPIEIKVDKENNYTIIENGKPTVLPLTYRVKFIDIEGTFDYDAEEGSGLPKLDTREGFVWKCETNNSKPIEWNYIEDRVTSDLYCRQEKKD